eukprot:1160822-Pelagomonas_calceolata.AAC.4
MCERACWAIMGDAPLQKEGVTSHRVLTPRAAASTGPWSCKIQAKTVLWEICWAKHIRNPAELQRALSWASGIAALRRKSSLISCIHRTSPYCCNYWYLLSYTATTLVTTHAQ